MQHRISRKCGKKHEQNEIKKFGQKYSTQLHFMKRNRKEEEEI